MSTSVMNIPVLAELSPAPASIDKRQETLRSECAPNSAEATSQFCVAMKALKVVGSIIAVMALGALLISIVALQPPLAILGFCISFSMMLFIGLPLILASLADVMGEQSSAH